MSPPPLTSIVPIYDQTTIPFNFSDHFEPIDDLQLPPRTSTPRKATKRIRIAANDSLLEPDSPTPVIVPTNVSPDLQKLVSLIRSKTIDKFDYALVLRSFNQSHSALKSIRASINTTTDPSQLNILRSLLQTATESHNNCVTELESAFNNSLWTLVHDQQKHISDQAASHTEQLLQATSQINFLQQETEFLKSNNKDALEKLYREAIVYADKFRNEISTLNTKVASCGAELDSFKVAKSHLIAERDFFKANFSSKDQEASSLQSELLSLFSIIDRALSDNNINRDGSDNLPNALNFLLNHLSQLITTANSKHTTNIDRLNRDLNKLQTQLTTATSKNKKHENYIELLNQKLVLNDSNSSHTNTTITTLEQRIAESDALLQNKDHQIAELRNRFDDLQSRFNNVSDYLTETTTQLLLRIARGLLNNAIDSIVVG